MASKYLRNRSRKRAPNNVILIVCGGETESLYFKKFNIDLGEIRVQTLTEGKNPSLIVKRAVAERSLAKYNQVWCVFDKDDFIDYDEAINVAETNGVKVACSNQAFELWFILHFEKRNGLLDRKHYQSILEGYKSIYSRLKSKMDTAINNAKHGHQNHVVNGGNPSDWESCTLVYRLVEELNRWKR
jgi:hypothetical protein